MTHREPTEEFFKQLAAIARNGHEQACQQREEAVAQ